MDRVELAVLLGDARRARRRRRGRSPPSTAVSASRPRAVRRSVGPDRSDPCRAEKSTSASASSTSRCWSSASSDLRVTFSVASTVRSATSLRIRSSERRVSASMSRRAAATSSSRFSLAVLGGLGLRRLRRLAGAGDDVLGLLAGLLEPLAVLVEQLVGLLGACARAASIDSAIALARLSSASRIRGKATLLSTHIVNPNTSSVQIISPRPGETRKLPELLPPPLRRQGARMPLSGRPAPSA